MRKRQIVASFTLLFALATILTQVPTSKPPLPYGRGSDKRGSDSFPTPTKELSPASRQQVVETYGRLPLSFEANHGQTDASVKFLSRGNGYTLFLTANEAVLALRRSEPSRQAGSASGPSEPQSEPRAPVPSGVEGSASGQDRKHKQSADSADFTDFEERFSICVICEICG